MRRIGALAAFIAIAGCGPRHAPAAIGPTVVNDGCPHTTTNSGHTAIPPGRHSSPTAEAALREGLLNGVGGHTPKLPSEGWVRAADEAGLAVFRHAYTDGRPTDIVQVGREPDGGWFVAGWGRCQ